MGARSMTRRSGLPLRLHGMGAVSAWAVAAVVAALLAAPLPAWGDDGVTPAQLAETNRELDTARSTATVALVVAVAALLLAAVALVAARTGRSRR